MLISGFREQWNRKPVFGYLRSLFGAVGNLPIEAPADKTRAEGLSELGLYLCDDWANYLDGELEALAEKLKGGES